MRVLVTGADGYIGAVVGSRLVEQGFDVVGADCGFYRDGWLYNDDRPRPLTFTKDVRRMTPKMSRGLMRSCTLLNCRTTLSVSSTNVRHMKLTILARSR